MFVLVYISNKGVLQPEYIVSSRGKSMLTHNGYKYVQNGHPKNVCNVVRTNWRCAYYVNNRYVCLAKARTFLDCDGVESVTFDGVHFHVAPKI